MIRTFQALRHVNPGFTDPAHVVTLRVTVPESLVPDPDQTIRLHQQIAQAIARIPGVQSVGVTSSITMDG